MKTASRVRQLVAMFALPSVVVTSAGCEAALGTGSSGGNTNGSTDTSAPTPMPSTDNMTTLVCVPPGAPITHSADIAASETWASGIHVVPATLRVRAGARLTIEPCTEIRLGADASIIVDPMASGIDALGGSTTTITFHRQAAESAWGSVRITAPATANFAYTTFDGGGGTRPHAQSDYEGATLVVRGDFASPTAPDVVSAQHVSITGSTGLGIFMQSARFAAASKALTVKGAGWYPVYGGIASATSLPDGHYVGNAIDRILLQAVGSAAYDDSGALTMDATLRDLGLPYLVGTTPASIRVGDGRENGPPALLTIEPNVTLLFTPQGQGGRSQLLVSGHNVAGVDQPQGALVVLGTAQAPVTFTSAAAVPAPGDWQGLYFAGTVDPRTNVAGARILDAGGSSGTVGVCESAPNRGTSDATCAVVISVSSPPSPFLHGSTIADSANCGVYRLWRGADVELAAQNHFTRVPGCLETDLPDTHNECINPTTCATAP